MPIAESLDELIAKKALEFADQVKAAAAIADKEEEIRIETEKQLAFIQRAAGIKLEGKHEFTVASGRVDSVYSRVIIEYKNPKSPGDRIGPKADSPGSKKVVEQIRKRFYDMRREHGQPLNSMFGVGLDGNHFIFVRCRDEKWQVQDPVEVNKVSAERFLWALFNLGSKGKAFSPEYLAGDFGSEGGNTIAIAGIHALYDAIVTTDNPKAQTFFSQWKILFGEVCGYEVDNPSDKIKKLAEFYHVSGKAPKPAELLFAVHTYYALFMKLLAAEIVAFFHKLPTPLQKMMQATTSNKLKREMDELEAGSIFRHLNITNFLEGDLFAWYTGVWTEPIEKLVREMVTRLDDYNPGTLSEDPSGSRDLLKKLYQQLFPKSVRHDLGEYYTPDWLAEHVLNELGYHGDPDKRLLDPACGSGTFLIMAINRIRKWYGENRERCRFDEGDLGRKILANVIGFDLNPLAVMAARTNYLIAIRDLIGQMDKVEIPVYLCDSILTPSEYGELTAGRLGHAKEFKTAATVFVIPTEIATTRDDVGKYAEQLEYCVRNGCSPEEFIERCRDEGLPITDEFLHVEVYRALVSLDKANKNGVWARIIKNAFAPLFVGKVDYVAGNPPWINWNNLPKDYRGLSEQVWRRYRLWPEYLLGASQDFSKLFVYVCADAYLRDAAELGFVITQSVFKTAGGDLFRKFVLPKGIGLNLRSVDDLSRLQPFEGAVNRTAVMHIKKGQETVYPVRYAVWNPPSRYNPSQDDELTDVLRKVRIQEHIAYPVGSDTSSQWLTGPKKAVEALKEKVAGVSGYRGNIGVHTYGANGIFFIEILKDVSKNLVLIRNYTHGAKKVVHTCEITVERSLIRPLLRGRDIKMFEAVPSISILFPYETDGKIISEHDMKRSYGRVYEYFRSFQKELSNRSEYVRRKRSGEWYQIYCTYPSVFSPVKVCWSEVSNDLHAGVVSNFAKDSDELVNIVPDHTCVVVGLSDVEEAHYLAALLNTSMARLMVRSYIVGHPSPHVLLNVGIPKYRAKEALHRTLSQLSRKAHDARASENSNLFCEIGDEIDSVAAKLWAIDADELKAIQDALQEAGVSRNDFAEE